MDTFKLLCKAYKDDCFSPKFMEYNEMLKKAEEEITVKMFKQHIVNEIALGRGSKLQNSLHNSLQNQKAELKAKLAKDHNNGYMFITINPKPSVSLNDFIKLLKKISSKTCFDKCLYVLEQRGDSAEHMGEGFHAHMLVKRNLNYKPTKLKTNVKNSCKKIVGNIHNEHQLNIQTIGEEFAKDKQNYIICDKTGDGKDKKQIIDKKWREQQKIDKYLGEIIFT